MLKQLLSISILALIAPRANAGCVLDYDLSTACSAANYAKMQGALISPQIQLDQSHCFELNHVATLVCPINEAMTAYYTTPDGLTNTASSDATHLLAAQHPLPPQPPSAPGVNLPFLQPVQVTSLTNYVHAGTLYSQLTVPMACVGSETNGTTVCGYEVDCNNCPPNSTCYNDNSGPIVTGPNSNPTYGTAVILTKLGNPQASEAAACSANLMGQVATKLTTVYNYYQSSQGLPPVTGGSSSGSGAPASIPPPAPPANFTTFTAMPLIAQSNTDLLNLVNNTYKAGFTKENGWCVPTASTMFILGLKGISSPLAVFGNSFDNPVASVFDPLTNKTYGSYAVQEKRAADTLGYNWGLLAGGFTDANLNNIANLATNGQVSQGALNFATVKSDIETLGYGYLLELISYPNKTLPFTSHAVVVNGIDGNYMKIFDPWGRIYDLQVIGQTSYNANFQWYSYGQSSAMLYNISDPIFGLITQNWVSSAGYTSLTSLGYTLAGVPDQLGHGQTKTTSAIDQAVNKPITFTKISRISGDTTGYVQTYAIVYSYVKAQGWGAGDYWDSQNSVFAASDSSWQSGVTKSLSGTTSPTNAGAPVISPSSAGGATLTASFGGYVSGYQWYKNGVAVPGATSQNLYLLGGPNDGGSYQLVATNANGSITSATITYNPAAPPAPVSTGPAVITVKGSNTIITAPFSGTSTASGYFATFQWYKNGVAVVGATGDIYSLAGLTSDTGTYYVTAKNPGGTATSPSVTYVSPATNAIVSVINSLLLGQ